MIDVRKLKGLIVEESLTDNRILNGLDFVHVRITDSERSENRWHIYTVWVSQDNIVQLQQKLKRGPWYMHFWDDSRIVVVFPDKIFEMHRGDKGTWKPAIDHGRSLGIPFEQLDFLIT